MRLPCPTTGVPRLLLAAVLACPGVSLTGCASTGESASIDTLTADVGRYPAPPSAVVRPRLGVPPLTVSGQRGGAFGFDINASDQLAQNAADQLTTLWMKSRRFKMIERAQLGQLLSEQDLEGIVRPDQLAAVNEVQGVDLLCLGKVTNFEIRVDRTRSGVKLGGSSSRLNEKLFGKRDPLDGFRGGFDKKNSTIIINCGVDLRLVNPSTGSIEVADTIDINRELKADSLGIDLDLFETRADADIQITESDAGKILRLALDQAIAKMLPDVDDMLIRDWDEADHQADAR